MPGRGPDARTGTRSPGTCLQRQRRGRDIGHRACTGSIPEERSNPGVDHGSGTVLAISPLSGSPGLRLQQGRGPLWKHLVFQGPLASRTLTCLAPVTGLLLGCFRSVIPVQGSANYSSQGTDVPPPVSVGQFYWSTAMPIYIFIINDSFSHHSGRLDSRDSVACQP